MLQEIVPCLHFIDKHFIFPYIAHLDDGKIFEEAQKKCGGTSVNAVGNRRKTSAHWGSVLEGRKKPAISIALLVHCLATWVWSIYVFLMQDPHR